MRDFFVPKFSGYEKITIQHFFGKSVGFKKKKQIFLNQLGSHNLCQPAGEN